MNLKDAIDAHSKWKVRLRMFLSGTGEKLDPAVVERDNQCDLGKWIHGEGARHGASADYQKLRTEHALFHRCAAKVVRTAMAGKKAEAGAMLTEAGEFTQTSQKTVIAIQALARSSAA